MRIILFTNERPIIPDFKSAVDKLIALQIHKLLVFKLYLISWTLESKIIARNQCKILDSKRYDKTQTGEELELIKPITAMSSLAVNGLRACVYVYIRQLSSFRTPMLWFIDLTVATCHIQCRVYANLFHEKTDKTRGYSKSIIFE